ncbi:MAG: hypothetical protein KIT48_05340 [Pseudolabrys sp.]|nr:hypothetical protein [Pseudolabrys sp.]
MKTGLLALACLISMGVIAAPVAEAKPGPKSRHHVVRKTVKKNSQSGVNVDSQDIDGDGTPDTVATPQPKIKPKPRKRGATISTQDMNGDGVPDTVVRTRAKPAKP